MAYKPYANTEDYTALFPGEEITEAALKTASRHIDTLTFNRICAAGFGNLTEFQREIIVEVVCRQAKFERDYDDLIGNALASYSINGVSMNFGGDSWNVLTAQGVAMLRELYGLLEQTGLCCRIAR